MYTLSYLSQTFDKGKDRRLGRSKGEAGERKTEKSYVLVIGLSRNKWDQT